MPKPVRLREFRGLRRFSHGSRNLTDVLMKEGVLKNNVCNFSDFDIAPVRFGPVKERVKAIDA